MGHIWTLSGNSYRDALSLLQRAGSTVAIAVALMAAANVIGIGVDYLIGTALGRQIANTLVSVGGIWLASPYLVSLYRLLLLNEKTNPGVLRGTEVSQRFFAWSALFAFIAALPGFVFSAFAPPGLSPQMTEIDPATGALAWATLFLLIAMWVFTTRTITLLPAAALGVDGGIVEALQHSRGRFWFIVGAVTVPLLPVTLFGLLLTASTRGPISLVFSIGMALVLLILAVAVTANLYRWLMDNPK